MRLFDTHAHYDSGAFNADRLEVLASMPGQGVELILNPGCDLDSSKTAVELAERFPFVYAAVGVHPSDCEGFSQDTVDGLRALAAHPKVRAVGEIGQLISAWTTTGRTIRPTTFKKRSSTLSWSWRRSWDCL